MIIHRLGMAKPIQTVHMEDRLTHSRVDAPVNMIAYLKLFQQLRAREIIMKFQHLEKETVV